MELLAYKSYRTPDMEIAFWRTSNRQEVDFILDDRRVAIEVKAPGRVHQGDSKWLVLLCDDGPVGRRIVISLEPEPPVVQDRHGKIEVVSWRPFLTE